MTCTNFFCTHTRDQAVLVTEGKVADHVQEDTSTHLDGEIKEEGANDVETVGEGPSNSEHQDSVDEGPSDGVDEGPSDGVDEGPSDGVDEGPSDGVDEGPSDGVDERPSDGVDEGPSDGVDDESSDGVDEGPCDGVDERPSDEGPSDGEATLSLSDWKYKDSEVYLISTGIHYVHVYVMHYPVQSITKALLTAEHFLFCEEAEKC